MKHKIRYIIHSVTIMFGVFSFLKIFFEIEIFPMRYMIWPAILWTIMDFTIYPLLNIRQLLKLFNKKSNL